MRARSLIGTTLLALSVSAVACSASQAPGAVDGTVLNVDGTPLPGVYVMAAASGHVTTFGSGYHTCYRTGLAITDNTGAFRMPDAFSNAPSPVKIDADWRSVEIQLYKLHFQTTEASEDEDARRNDRMLSSLGRSQANTNRVQYMEPASTNREQRIRYLVSLATEPACEAEGNPTLLPFYQAVYAEATELAVTPYEKYLVEQLRYLIAVRSSPATTVRKPTLPDNVLIAAVMSGHPSTVMNVLRTTPGDVLTRMLDDRARDDRTALMAAAAAGNDEMVRELITAGADANKVTFSGETALGLALKQLRNARAGKRTTESAFRNTVATLVQAPGIDLDQVCIDRKTPLIYTGGGWYPGLPDIFKFILEQGADPNVELYKATRHRQRALGAVLDNEIHSPSAGMPMLHALLASKRLDVNAVVFEGTTALIYTASEGRPDILKLLLEAGADPNVSIPPGITALGKAVNTAILNPSREEYVRALKVLLASNAIDVSVPAYDGKLAIELAKRASRPDLIELLESRTHGRPN